MPFNLKFSEYCCTIRFRLNRCFFVVVCFVFSGILPIYIGRQVFSEGILLGLTWCWPYDPWWCWSLGYGGLGSNDLSPVWFILLVGWCFKTLNIFSPKSLPSAFSSMHLLAVLPWISCYCVVLVVKYWFSIFVIPSIFISCLSHVKITFPFFSLPLFGNFFSISVVSRIIFLFIVM